MLVIKNAPYACVYVYAHIYIHISAITRLILVPWSLAGGGPLVSLARSQALSPVLGCSCLVVVGKAGWFSECGSVTNHMIWPVAGLSTAGEGDVLAYRDQHHTPPL